MYIHLYLGVELFYEFTLFVSLMEGESKKVTFLTAAAIKNSKFQKQKLFILQLINFTDILIKYKVVFVS